MIAIKGWIGAKERKPLILLLIAVGVGVLIWYLKRKGG